MRERKTDCTNCGKPLFRSGAVWIKWGDEARWQTLYECRECPKKEMVTVGDEKPQKGARCFVWNEKTGGARHWIQGDE